VTGRLPPALASRTLSLRRSLDVSRLEKQVLCETFDPRSAGWIKWRAMARRPGECSDSRRRSVSETK
jgi:hypothetical protein